MWFRKVRQSCFCCCSHRFQRGRTVPLHRESTFIFHVHIKDLDRTRTRCAYLMVDVSGCERSLPPDQPPCTAEVIPDATTYEGAFISCCIDLGGQCTRTGASPNTSSFVGTYRTTSVRTPTLLHRINPKSPTSKKQLLFFRSQHHFPHNRVKEAAASKPIPLKLPSAKNHH